MAPTAIETELTVVNIVGTVTIVAAATQLHLDVEWLPMAGFAVDVAMCTVEPEICLRIVIESPLRPVDRRMAKCAIIGKTVTVGIF